MLFMHETHRVMGRHASAFEDMYRNEWMGALATGDEARLVWYLNHAMGSGPAYQVVTITACADGAAWERLAGRMLTGDLSDITSRLDALRYEVQGKILTPVSWSALQDVDLVAVPTDGREHELSLYMQDTGWPHAPLDDYIRCWDEIYYRPLSKAPARMRILDIQACFQVAHGSYRRREAMLWQKIDDSNNYAALVHLLTKEVPPEHRAPGSYMFEALTYRDQWQSRLLRTSDWSPLY